jgi:NAD(P)-dependent dehydrogenase (short-subunit alcohol dehydrogenase family)
LFSFTQAKYGRVDLVFANAGVPETQNAFEDVYDENGDLVEPPMAVIDVNLKSVALSEFEPTSFDSDLVDER